MADCDSNIETEVNKKRNRSEVSSTSSTNEVDTSIGNETKNPKKKQNKDKKPNQTQSKDERKRESNTTSEIEVSPLKDIKSQLAQINKKLSNVMTKDDGSLRTMIKEMIQQMKEELLKSVEKRIEILESKIFDKDNENDKLKNDIEQLNKTVAEQYYENDTMKQEIRKSEEKTDEFLNDVEQYSRLNSIRISGIKEETYIEKAREKVTVQDQTETPTDEKQETSQITTTETRDDQISKLTQQELRKLPENAEQTTELVIKTLNEKLPGLALRKEDIDMCHRVGRRFDNKNRQIIVKFTSRLVKSKVMRRKKTLPKPIFVTEDLTRQNHHVLMCVKWKMADEVATCWTMNGNIFYKNKIGNIHQVHYRDYSHWVDLTWPERTEKPRGKR